MRDRLVFTGEDCMKRSQLFRKWIGLLIFCGAYGLTSLMTFPADLHAQTFSVLHSFVGEDGYEPLAGVTLDAHGNVYGMTAFGGQDGGVAYKLTKRNSTWTYSQLYKFTQSSGGVPIAKLLIGRDGSLYGSATEGGSTNNGTVFNLRPSPNFCAAFSCPWDLTVLHNFALSSDGSGPTLITLDPAGNIYGTTTGGGRAGLGTVYKLSASQGWARSILTDFAGTGSGESFSGVILDQNGNLYGEGYSDNGTVFEVTNSGDFQVLHRFNVNDGTGLFFGMVFDAQGNLYGQTAAEGSNGGGTVFELSPSGGSWTFNLLYAFSGMSNSGTIGAASLTMDAQGNLYGTTFGNGAHNAGTVFKLTPSAGGWTYTDLHDFTGGDDGCTPWSDVVMDSQGNLYGTASQCGQGGGGTVWQITP